MRASVRGCGNLGGMRRLLLWAPPIVYMIVIFHFSSESDPLPVVTQHVWDKLLHFSEYGGLALLFVRALRGEGLGFAGAAILAVVLVSVYGATDEYHQSLVPMRDPDIHDWIADTIGGSLGAVGYVAVALAIARAAGVTDRTS